MHRTNGDSKGTALGAQGYMVNVYRDAVPGVYDATQLRHQEMNAIQEEIANVIEAEGITLNDDTELVSQMSQLNSAIDNKLKASRILNDSSVNGGFVDDALDNLNLKITTLNSDDIINYSNVSGVKVTNALNTLRTSIMTLNSDNISNNSNISGVNVTNALNNLQTLQKHFITGCRWFRDDNIRNLIRVTSGKAVGKVAENILEVPISGGSYRKKLENGTGYQGGDNNCGVPGNVILEEGSHVYIFLIKRGNETFDIGFDTSSTAYNLLTDQICNAIDYRRIGFLQVESIEGNNVNVYNAIQHDNYHEIIGGKSYKITLSSEEVYLVGTDQYLPAMSIVPVYQVAAPVGEAKCLVLPICYTHSSYEEYRNWLFDSGIFCGMRIGPLTFGVPSIMLPALNIYGYNGFFIRATPYTNITVWWYLLGFFDNRLE